MTTMRTKNDLPELTPPLEQADTLRLLGEQSAAIIHELRAPLQGIRAQLRAMQRRWQLAGGDDFSDRFQLLYDELDRMGGLLDQYLQLTACPQLARETAALLRSLAISAGVRVTLQTEDALPPISGREAELRRVLVNLLVNAIQSGGDAVWLGVTRQNGMQTLTCADNGPGVPPALRERIFEPYFTTKEKGGGLGLALARRIARDHGGDLTLAAAAISAAPGIASPETAATGATFALRLPEWREENDRT